LLPGDPERVFLGSRKLRLAPQGYAPWTPLHHRSYVITLYPRPWACWRVRLVSFAETGDSYVCAAVPGPGARARRTLERRVASETLAAAE